MSANPQSSNDEAAGSSGADDQDKAGQEEGGEPLDDARMSLLEHLQELRVRLRNAGIAFVLALIASFYFVSDLFEILVRPVKLAMIDLGLMPEINQPGIGTGFWVYFKLSMVVGILFASPFIFWELWKFVAPGLYKKEKKIALLITGATAVCFAGGAFFGYMMLARTTSVYLLGIGDKAEEQRVWAEKARAAGNAPAPAPTATPPAAKPVAPGDALLEKLRSSPKNLTEAEKQEIASRPVGLSNTLMVDQVLDFQSGLLLGCGVAFELPVILSVLGWIGLISSRGLWKFNKYALVLSAVVGGVLTPSPDAISQLMLAGPLYVLYNISIVIIFLIERARRKKESEGELTNA